MIGEHMLTLMGEYQDFILQRMKQNFDLMQRLAYCKSADEMLAALQSYWIAAVEDFGKEVIALTSIAPRRSRSSGAMVPPAPARVIRFPTGKAGRSQH